MGKVKNESFGNNNVVCVWSIVNSTNDSKVSKGEW